MNPSKRSYFVLILLGLVFLAPGLLAYVFYMNPEWLLSPTTNKGVLLDPPIEIGVSNRVQKTKIPGQATLPKWRLILWNPTACEADCIAQLDKLARIRLALGRRLYEVTPQLLMGEDAPPLPLSLKKTLDSRDIQVGFLPNTVRGEQLMLKKKPMIFIASPTGHLVLAYPPSVKPNDVFHDMKQMLG